MRVGVEREARVGVTEDARKRFRVDAARQCVRCKGVAQVMKKEYSFRVISNQVRFGCGYRTIDGKRQYFAWHGYPDRNSDYFTTSEISESEYNEINKKYPKEIIANREKAEVFRNKYVDGHPVILEGWDRLL